MKQQINSNAYTPEVLNYLQQAGWFEGREVDISRHEKMWALNNLPAFDKAKAFMREFGGLLIRFYNRKLDREDSMVIDVEEGLRHDVPEKVEVYAERAEKLMTIIGAAYRYTMNLVMDEEGYMYAAFDTYVIKLGYAPCQFFNTALDLPQEVDTLD